VQEKYKRWHEELTSRTMKLTAILPRKGDRGLWSWWRRGFVGDLGNLERRRRWKREVVVVE